jgi:hypothetical protein
MSLETPEVVEMLACPEQDERGADPRLGAAGGDELLDERGIQSQVKDQSRVVTAPPETQRPRSRMASASRSSDRPVIGWSTTMTSSKASAS